MKPTTNIRKEPDGWQVRLVRGGVEYSKYFRFSDGGVRKSFQAAKKYRDKVLKQVGERKWKKGPRKKATNNSSGVTGVSRNPYGRWVATWQEEGKQRFKTFALKREAIAFREKQARKMKRAAKK